MASAPLPAVVPGEVPGVVGDTGTCVGAGRVKGALGVLGLKTGGGGAGNAPTWASAVAKPAQTAMVAPATDNASLTCMSA